MLSAKRCEIFCKWKRSQRREIEVRVVPPHECFYFEIEVNLVEEAQIAQRPIEFAASHESGINDLHVIIVEANAQNV